MRIEAIQFKNYRQYRDTRIEFSHIEGGRSLTIIQGPNGSGKTNILNAISWCLYGEELHLGDKYKGLPIINNIALKNMALGQLADVVVEIFMRDDTYNKMPEEEDKARGVYRYKNISDLRIFLPAFTGEVEFDDIIYPKWEYQENLFEEV